MHCFAITSRVLDITNEYYAHEYGSVPHNAIWYRDARIGKYPWRCAKSGRFVKSIANVRIC